MTDTTNHAATLEVVTRWFEKARDTCAKQGRHESALLWSDGLAHLIRMNAALDALTRELEDAKAEAERLKESMQRHFIEEHLAGDGPETDRWKRQCAALDQRHEEDAAEVKRLNHALTGSNAEVLEATKRIKALSEAPMLTDRGRAILYGEEIDRLKATIAAQSARIATLEEALTHLASEEAAFRGGSYCSEYARAALAKYREYRHV